MEINIKAVSKYLAHKWKDYYCDDDNPNGITYLHLCDKYINGNKLNDSYIDGIFIFSSDKAFHNAIANNLVEQRVIDDIQEFLISDL
jgi:hypothetical protein